MSEKRQKLMPYQKEFPDGFILNKLREKPKARGGILYNILRAWSIHGDVFLPTWDSTDHFHFVCKKCKSVADVLMVKFNTNYGGGVRYALFFYLGCRSCGVTGQRKIYLDPRAEACKFQTTYDQGNVYIYGEDEKPCRVVTLDEIVKNWLEKQKQIQEKIEKVKLGGGGNG